MAAVVNKDECIGCGSCADACPAEAVTVVDDKAQVDESACLSCGACAEECPVGAITV